jgi:molecular chaperone HscB
MNGKAELSEILTANAWQLFEYLPPTFAIDITQLHQKFYQLQQQFHPDKWINSTDYQLAVNVSAHINREYQRLKSPFERSIAILAYHQIEVDTETNHNLSPEFLEQQFAYNEMLTENNNDTAKLNNILQTIITTQTKLYKELDSIFKEKNLAKMQVKIIDIIYQLAFYQKLENKIYGIITNI